MALVIWAVIVSLLTFGLPISGVRVPGCKYDDSKNESICQINKNTAVPISKNDGTAFLKFKAGESIKFDHANDLRNIYNWHVEATSTNATRKAPIRILIMNGEDEESIELPTVLFDPKDKNTTTVTTTRRVQLCPDNDKENRLNPNSTLEVRLSTKSEENVTVTIRVMVKSVWLGWDGTEWSNSSDSDDIEGTNFTTFSSVGIGRPTVRYFRTSLLTNRWTPEAGHRTVSFLFSMSLF